MTKTFRTGSWSGTFGGLVAVNEGVIRNSSVSAVFSGAGARYSQSFGGLVGRNYGAIIDCYANVQIEEPLFPVGGLVGRNYGLIEGSHTTGDVAANAIVGGLVGWAEEGSVIRDSYSTARVRGLYPNSPAIGGLIGRNQSTQTSEPSVSRCHATGDVLGGTEVGGLIGRNFSGEVVDSFATGNVVAQDRYAGGLVGHFSSVYGGASNCHATGSVTGVDVVGGLIGMAAVDKIFHNNWSSSTVVGENSVGGLIGQLMGNLSHSHAEGDVSGIEGVGGLVGEFVYDFTDGRRMEYCHATGEVNGVAEVGGLVGRSAGIVRVFSSYATGDVSGESLVGGLFGHATFRFSPSTMIERCYASGSVSGVELVGGLIGFGNLETSDVYSMGPVTGENLVAGSIANLATEATAIFAAGRVHGQKESGGLVGSLRRDFSDPESPERGVVHGGFWDVSTSIQTGSAAGTGLPTAAMQSARTFVDAGWDFDEVWTIAEGDTYPYLRFQPPPPIVESPAQGSIVAHDVDSVSFMGTLPEEGELLVEWRLNGGSWSPAEGGESWSFQATTLEEGANMVEIRWREAHLRHSATAVRVLHRGLDTVPASQHEVVDMLLGGQPLLDRNYDRNMDGTVDAADLFEP